jgi:serine/threonine protein kinase
LPFPDAKGPAGLITAQLKQTPQPPSVANPKANLPAAADRVILKCLEKDKNNRHADVSALALALQEVLDAARESSNPFATPLPSSSGAMPMPPGGAELSGSKDIMASLSKPSLQAGGSSASPSGYLAPGASTPSLNPVHTPQAITGYPQPSPNNAVDHVGHDAPAYSPAQPAVANIPEGARTEISPAPTRSGSKMLIWWVIGLLFLGAGVGAIAALFMQ